MSAAVQQAVTLDLGDLDQVRLSVATAEYLSVMAMTVDVIGNWQRGLPAAWQQQVAEAVGRTGREAVLPVAEPAVAIVPGCVLPSRPVWTAGVGGFVDEIRSADPSEVQESIAAEFGDTAPPAWQNAARQPGRWITAYSDATEAVGGKVVSLLKRARPLIDREAERAGLATVRDTLPTFLSNLNSRIGFDDGMLTFSHPSPGHYELGDRTLVLVPMVSGDRMLLTNFEEPDTVWIAYPVPGLGDIWSAADPPPAADALASLLGGSIRSVILRRLTSPMTMGALASILDCLPATATFHCDRLERAGLITRTRRGRTIRVSRTTIGESLLDLYRQRS